MLYIIAYFLRKVKKNLCFYHNDLTNAKGYHLSKSGAGLSLLRAQGFDLSLLYLVDFFILFYTDNWRI